MLIPFYLSYLIMNETELFFTTIKSGNLNNTKAQLKRNPDLVNAKDSRGFTPLIFATYFDKEDIAKSLIEHNAPIDAKDKSGNTALIGVCFKGNDSLASYLIEHGADINAINTNGTTPLIFSAMYNKVNNVKLLLENHADVSLKDNEGKTALDYAHQKGFSEIVSMLKN